MRVARFVTAAVVAMLAFSATATEPVEAQVRYTRIADLGLQSYATWYDGEELIGMEPYAEGESQEWTVSTGAYTFLTVVQTPWPTVSRCWEVEEDGGEGSPIFLTDCDIYLRTQWWQLEGNTADGVMFRSRHVDHMHLCAGYDLSEEVPVLREVPCDENDPTQRFMLPGN